MNADLNHPPNLTQRLPRTPRVRLGDDVVLPASWTKAGPSWPGLRANSNTITRLIIIGSVSPV